MGEIENVIVQGIVFKRKNESEDGEQSLQKGKKKKTKSKNTYVHGLHNSGSAKMKAEYKKRRASRHKKP